MLWEIETPTTVETVACALVDADGSQSDGAEQTEEIKQLEIALYHVHLPKMADVGVINYDPRTGTIRTNDTTYIAYNVLDHVLSENDF
uniref:DUF7344 domain-containing protein n=1 Tax=Natronococcus wangiae TaxID=3068275 RepID=UPI00273EBFF1|nr:hypothetical protein [Natronococcus sp. AD5]